jgi:GR25 family glycosyltransferase involved in LPS biosynthesis
MNKYGYQKMSKLENFGPVYLINLPDQVDRLDYIKKQFSKYNVADYKIVEAVDGRNSDLKDIVSGSYPKLKPSEIGCLASHINAIKMWLEETDDEYGIIMEDDCSFDTVRFWQFDWNYFMQNIPANADIIQLVMIKENNIKFNMHVKEQYDKNDYSSYAWSTACYVIKRSYAEKLLKMFLFNGKYEFAEGKYRNKPADVVLYNLGKAYSMPIFTYFVDTKEAINLWNIDKHKRCKRYIDEWWEANGNKYTKENFFDIENGLLKRKSTKVDIAFNIFHADGDSDVLKKRGILTKRATDQLINDFTKIDTPTIMIKDEKDFKEAFKKEKIKFDPKGWNQRGWKFGEFGIWASNYTAWKNFAKSDHEMLMLMEDDIILSKKFNQKLISYINQLPDDWDFFTVYIPPTGNQRYRREKEYLNVDRRSICRVYQSWSCLCYVVSKQGVDKLLKQVQSPVNGPIDHWLFYNKDLNGYAIKIEIGNICNIYSLPSTVQDNQYKDMTGII